MTMPDQGEPRQVAPEEVGAASRATAGGADVPQWLKDLRSEDIEPAAEIPDWMAPARAEAGGATAENLPEFVGRRSQVMSALRILEAAREEAANSGKGVSEIDLSRRFVDVGEGLEKKTLELTPENFVSLWSRLLESANPEQQKEILGVAERLVTGDGSGSLAARLFAEYGRERPDGVSDRLASGLAAVVSRLKDGGIVSKDAAAGLALAAKNEAGDKISLWNIIFWILGGLTEVGSRGADMVINEVVSVTGGGH